TALTAEFTDFFNRLEHAGFIVGRHNADQDFLVRERILELIKVYQTVTFNGKICDAIAVLLQTPAAIEHSFVLADDSDDVVAFVTAGFRHAFNSKVVTLSGSRGENNFLR